jgi:hypothetical protein
MTERDVKVKILEGWYTIDSILFSNHAKKVIKEGSKFREYVSLKGAMLSNLHELYTHIGYDPEWDACPDTLKGLVEGAQQSAKYGKKLASNMIKNTKISEALKKKIVRESRERGVKDVNTFADKVIHERFTQLAMDNIFVGVPILESSCATCTQDFKGQVLEDAYKMMRNSLIHLADTCSKT